MAGLIQRVLGYSPDFTSLKLYNPVQNWKLNDRGIYETEIFRRGPMSAHHMWLTYQPDSPCITQPITEEGRKEMWYGGKAKGPLREEPVDTDLMILRSDWYESLPVFRAVFNKGKFVYGERHGPGLGDIRSLEEDYHTAQQFIGELKRYFELKTFEDFRQFFTRSNLPETHVKALEAILK